MSLKQQAHVRLQCHLDAERAFIPTCRKYNLFCLGRQIFARTEDRIESTPRRKHCLPSGRKGHKLRWSPKLGTRLKAFRFMGSSQIRVPFWVHNIVRHPYKKGPQRDPNLESYPNTVYSSAWGIAESLEPNAKPL